MRRSRSRRKSFKRAKKATKRISKYRTARGGIRL